MGGDSDNPLAGIQQMMASTVAVGLQAERIRAVFQAASDMARGLVVATGALPSDEAVRECARLAVAMVDAVADAYARHSVVQGLTPEQVAELQKGVSQSPDWVADVLKESE